MSQHDGVIDNAAGAAVRADINSALAAIFTNHSGATAPTTTYAYMWWPDITSGWLKQRDAANAAWIKRQPIGTGARVDVASASTVDLDANAANSDYIRLTGTTAVNAVTLADGQKRLALAGGAVPLVHSSSLVLPGSANYTTTAGDLLLFIGEAAGVVRVMIWKGDGTPVVGLTASNTATLTNKRITARTGSTTSSATPTINTDNVDVYQITALAAAITSFTTNLSGTPSDGDVLVIEITDNGTPRAITWGASFESSGNATLPTTTVTSTKLTTGLMWNSATTKWRCVGVA